MYALAETIDPDAYLALARATFAEMALAGVTVVGEFHYLHHGPGGAPYDDRNEMGRVVLQAAAEAGIRIVLLDTCYLHGGSPALPRRRRRRLGAARRRARGRDASAGAGVGAAIHSVRAVDPAARGASSPRGRPRAARRCTRTSPSSRPRTSTRASTTARRRPSSCTTPAR